MSREFLWEIVSLGDDVKDREQAAAELDADIVVLEGPGGILHPSSRRFGKMDVRYISNSEVYVGVTVDSRIGAIRFMNRVFKLQDARMRQDSAQSPV